MPGIGNARKIWIVTQTSLTPVVASGLTGTPEPLVPQPLLSPAVYVEASRGTDINIAAAGLTSPAVSLIAMLPSPDGPPVSLGLVFSWVRDTTISYQDGGRSFHGHWATEYDAATAGAGYIWESDRSQGVFGSFLIGAPHESALWRIRRAQVDRVGRYLFTLQPVKPAAGLPPPDFTAVTDQIIRTEMEKSWDDLVHALSGDRVSQVVTSAKQIVESLLYFVLLRGGHIRPDNHELSALLAHLKGILEDKNKRQHAPFTDLDYHLIQKMRILHGGTHIGRIVINGRSVSTEFGMTVALDLIEILTSCGLVK
jgi:hypothetical protein